MAWVKKALRAWLREPYDPNVPLPMVRKDPAFSAEEREYTISVVKATNGMILSARQYDLRTDRSTSVVRIVPDGVNMLEEIAALIAEIKLR